MEKKKKMSMSNFVVLLVILQLTFVCSCSSVNSANHRDSNINSISPVAYNEETKSQTADDVQPKENTFDVESLCNELRNIKRMPHEAQETADDPIYDGLIAMGVKAIPCLVEKVTDTTVIEDPREAPHVHGFTVGDAAVFMLHRITKEPIEEILVGNYKDEWKTNGVYAYFSYVEKLENRKKIQLWWKNWMKENFKN